MMGRAMDEQFVADVAEHLRAARESESSDRVRSEDVARAYELLSRGVRLPSFDLPPLSICQTPGPAVSVADPGPGHIAVTSTRSDLLRGVVVHLEHIDRTDSVGVPGSEPYRPSTPAEALRARLHVGSGARCSVYLGRLPGGDQDDLLKSTRAMASTCSFFFSIGFSECKISLDGLAAFRALSVMRLLTELVIRDPDRQALAAAVNLNTPLVDDIGAGLVRTEPSVIAKRGIHLVARGGFDKIAWDNAGPEVPTRSVVETLGLDLLLDLAHEAHSVGLDTYLSGGLSTGDLSTAACSGVGGVGIGTSLHTPGAGPGEVGELCGERIRDVLAARDRAAGSTLARAAALLAARDLAAARGGPHSGALRERLFQLLRARDERSLEWVLAEHSGIGHTAEAAG
jgi:hypothetical protein